MAYEFWPAPMEGIFTPEFLESAAALELTERWMTSFLRLSENLPKLKIFKGFLAPYLTGGKPVCAQLMGRSPELLAEGAVLMQEAGAASVNLNFGCPAPRVLSNGAGGALLRDIPLMAAIVSVVKKRSPACEVSVKFRAGFRDFEEAWNIVPALIDAGADKLFIHYRTVKELYAVVPDREKRLEQLMTLAGKTPVILNGDFGPDDREFFGATGIMYGRKWLRDPGMLRRLAGKSDVPGSRLYYAILDRGIPEDALRGMRRMIFGAWDAPVPPPEEVQ